MVKILCKKIIRVKYILKILKRECNYKLTNLYSFHSGYPVCVRYLIFSIKYIIYLYIIDINSITLNQLKFNFGFRVDIKKCLKMSRGSYINKDKYCI